MNGPQRPIRYRAEPARPLQPVPPPDSGGKGGWIKWAGGIGLVVILLLVGAVLANSGGSDNAPAPKKITDKPVKPKPRPSQWSRDYDVQFAFANNPRGQALTISTVSVAGLNGKTASLTVKTKAGCDNRYLERRRWELRANNPQLVRASPVKLSRTGVFGATCNYQATFSWLKALLIMPRRTELWVQIPAKPASNMVALRIAVPPSHRGIE